MDKIEFIHGGKEYDDRYPDGIPTRVNIITQDDKEIDRAVPKAPEPIIPNVML